MFEVRRPHGPVVGLPRDLSRADDQLAVVIGRYRALLDEPSVIEAIERDEIPIPSIESREHYFRESHLNYWLSGLDDLRVIQRLVPAGALKRVLDFGGATGRFARHLALADASSKVTIAELNVNHVAWVEKYFGPSVRAVKISPYPHFPIADRSVTLCVGLSVFTHIDAYESGWLAEINRVLADGGYAFLMIHSEHTWALLPNYPWLLTELKKFPLLDQYDPKIPMPGERLVFPWDPNSIEHNCNVFCHSDYIRRSWGKWFEVADILPHAHHNFQTVVVLRKRD
jgi:SAM-dependent methyltransferase